MHGQTGVASADMYKTLNRSLLGKKFTFGLSAKKKRGSVRSVKFNFYTWFDLFVFSDESNDFSVHRRY
jgi:hypothetical protein